MLKKQNLISRQTTIASRNMLNFKQFILERKRVSARVRALLDTRAKPYEYWLSKKFELPFPISKPMMTRMQNTQVEVEAFHVTDIDYIKTLFEVQNSSKSLSVTTEIETERDGLTMLGGIETAGGILVELVGDVPFAGDFDIFTSPDNQGRRWIDIYQFSTELKKNAGKLGNPDLLHNWELIYKKTILEHTKRFIKKNWHDLLDFGLDGDHMGYAVRTKEWAAIFWIGGEGFVVKGLDPDESLAETGVVNKLNRVEPEMRGKRDKIQKEARQTLFRMTKDLFDKAEDYFTDNLLDFFELGKEEKIYPYNELIMDNFTIQRVIYNYMYTPSDIENAIGEYLSKEEIESGSLEETEILKYFKKWVSGKVVSTGPKYPVVNW